MYTSTAFQSLCLMLIFRLLNIFSCLHIDNFFRFAHYLSLEDSTIVHGGER